jgi:hypothetical protein
MLKFSAPLEHTALVLAKAGTLPYPPQWERHLVVDDGWKVFARPIRPDDEPLILHLLRQVSREDLRLRFFDSIKEFSHPFLVRLTQLDYARAMAFLAFDEASGDILGVVRVHWRERRVCDPAEIGSERPRIGLGAHAADHRIRQIQRPEANHRPDSPGEFRNVEDVP